MQHYLEIIITHHQDFPTLLMCVTFPTHLVVSGGQNIEILPMPSALSRCLVKIW
jgi:hypothetical protein